VLKMRGSAHDRSIREFTIDATGMHLGRRFGNVTGILGGAPMHVSPGDIERIWAHHEESAGATGKERRRSGDIRT
jgi:circadian clock protein KaiC